MPLYLNDMIKLNGYDPNDFILIRHSTSDKNFKECYKVKYIKEYTQLQKPDFAKNYQYWMVFISDDKTTARYFATYKAMGYRSVSRNDMPDGFPVPQMFENGTQYQLEETDIMSEYKNRLVIQWGKATISWYQRTVNPKEVLAIHSNEFKGYDGCWTYGELREIFNDPTHHDDTVTALKSVYAVYLIVDMKTGKQYVGSAYGTDGLYGRWAEYIQTYHGNNKKIIRYLEHDQMAYNNFQFSILKTFPPKKKLAQIVLDTEKIYKDKLLTRIFGLNDN